MIFCSTELDVLSLFSATCWIDATISCIAADASCADPDILSALPATPLMDLPICSMEDDICSMELAVLSAFPATCGLTQRFE